MLKLVVWCKEPRTKVLNVLGPVLKRFPGLVIDVINDVTTIPSTGGHGVILALGNDPKTLVEGLKVVPKGRTITSLRGGVYTSPFLPSPLMFSYSPGIFEMDYGKYVDLLTDVGIAARFASTGDQEPKLGTYTYVQDFLQSIARVEELYAATGKPVECVLDLETVGLNPYALPEGDHPGAYIVTIQLSVEEGMAHVVYFTGRSHEEATLSSLEFLQQLGWILTTNKISMGGANLKFDTHWLAVRAKLKCTNFKFDTTLVGSLLDENRSNGLDVHAKIYAPDLGGYSDSFDRSIDKSRMDNVPQGALLPYAGGDTDAGLRVRKAMKEELLKDPALTSFYVNILHPAARAFEMVEQGGVLVDMDAYQQLEVNLNFEIDTLVLKARKVLGGRVVAKHQDEDKRGGLNLTKASLLVDFMFSPMGLNLTPLMTTEKSGAPSTALDHLMMFKDVPEAKEFVSLLKDYSSATKTLQTYVYGFKKHIRSDGNFHPAYFLHAAGKDSAESGGTVCMPAGELVLTDRGYLPVQKVSVGAQVISHAGVPRKVVGRVVNGVKPLIRVTLSNGLSLRTTLNHPYRIEDGWVEAGQLQLGMQAWAHSKPEEWGGVTGWDDYAVSNWGRVKNLKTGRMVTQYPKGKWGHLKVTLRRNGCQKRGPDLRDVAVHRLVAKEFVEVWGGVEVRHLNGVAWDNTAENLEWGSSQENREDASIHGSMNKRKSKQAKLTEQAVEFIRSQPPATLTGGLTNKQLSEMFGVCQRLIRAVRHGDRWEYKEPGYKRVTFKPATVVGLEMLPPEMTYGLEVEEDHSHVTGGIVTHNTGRLSAKDPAFQCLKGDSQVTTSQGLQSIADIVDGYAKGREFKVLTHTGKWKPVVGVYKNGVRPVFDVRFGTGKIVTSTENHPYLTSRGWVRTDQLKPGDICYELRAPNEGVHQSNVLQLGSHEESLHKSDQQGLAQVRGSWHQGVREVDGILQLPSGHGGEACCGLECGAEECGRGLRTRELRVGAAEKASEQSHQQQEDHPQRPNEDRSRVGIRGGDQSGTVALSALCGDVDGASLDEGHPWDRSVFQEVEVVSITPAGECETFDLTIQDSHSFVANGVVVHNTIPKHTKWAKPLRRCFPAPEGMLVLENDYSQGELKVIACLANEETMIEAYSKGLDLHVITSGRFAGYSYDEMMLMKKENKGMFDGIRQLGKAGNFGLIYGMGAEGFRNYAELNYGVKLSIEEAAKFRDGFFHTYNQLPVYHREYKAFARKHGHVRSPLGRIRHLPLINSSNRTVQSQAERQSINSPVQGCLSDMLIWAIAESHKRGWFEQSPCFGAIHDAKYTYIPQDNHELYIERELELMENLDFSKVGWTPQLKFTADAKFGTTMADLKEYERKAP